MNLDNFRVVRQIPLLIITYQWCHVDVVASSEWLHDSSCGFPVLHKDLLSGEMFFHVGLQVLDFFMHTSTRNDSRYFTKITNFLHGA